MDKFYYRLAFTSSTKKFLNVKLYKGFISLCIKLDVDFYMKKLVVDLTSLMKNKEKELTIKEYLENFKYLYLSCSNVFE